VLTTLDDRAAIGPRSALPLLLLYADERKIGSRVKKSMK